MNTESTYFPFFDKSKFHHFYLMLCLVFISFLAGLNYELMRGNTLLDWREQQLDEAHRLRADLELQYEQAVGELEQMRYNFENEKKEREALKEQLQAIKKNHLP